MALVWALFYGICLSLGYPSLNRYDPAKKGLADVEHYTTLVEEGISGIGNHVWRYRVIVPYMAKPIYWLVKDNVGTWNPVYFALLIVNSLFVASSALVLLLIVSQLTANRGVGLVCGLLFLGHFNISNFYLSGLVDSSEVFLMIVLAWSLLNNLWAPLPLIGFLGGLAKETFVPLSGAFAAGWYLSAGQREGFRFHPLAMVGGIVVLGLLSAMGLRSMVTGHLVMPWDISSRLMIVEDGLFEMFAYNIFNKGFLYTFFWLLPFGFLGLRWMPRDWAIASGVSVTLALLLAFGAGAGENIGRPLFSTAGPLLIVAAAMFIWKLVDAIPRSFDTE